MDDSAESGSVDVAAVLRRFAKPSEPHQFREFQTICRVVEASKRMMDVKMERFIKDLGERTLLLSYAGDGTPVEARNRSVSEVPGSKSLRSVQKTEEYYVHVCFAVAKHPLCGREECVRLEEPRVMSEGKKTGAEYAIGASFMQDPRALGHRGIQIIHMAWDRAHFGSISTIWRQHWTRSLLRGSPAMADMEADDAYLMQWVICTPCALHDAHNSIKWGNYGRFTDKKFMRDVFIAIASLGNCSRQLLDYVPQWLPTVLRVVDAEECPSAEELSELWSALVRNQAAVQTIVMLRLHWVDKELRCCVPEEGNIDEHSIPALVAHVLHQVWSFRKFTSSRWGSIGPSTRAMVAAMLTGVEHLVRTNLDDDDQSAYLLSGFNRMNAEVKEFVCTTAIYSFPSEFLVRNLLEDGRVSLHLEKLKEGVQEQWDYLSSLSDSTWETLASVCGMYPAEYRHTVLEKALTSMSFITFRIFSAAESLPFSLLRGDLNENLDSLVSGEAPEEPVAAKVRMLLLRDPLAKVRISNAVLLLQEISWTTSVVEQQHASASMVARYSPTVEQPALVCRAGVHMFRKLLPELSPAMKKVVRLREALQRLDRRRPRRAGAWQVHCGRAVEVSTTFKEEQRSFASKDTHLRVFASAKKIYDRMTDERRRELQRAAEHLAVQKEKEIQDEKVRLLAEMQRVETVNSEIQVVEGSVKLSSCQWVQKDIDFIHSLLQAPEFSADRVALRRQEILEAPKPPSGAELSELQDLPVYEGPEEPMERPEWVSLLVRHRDELKSVLFICTLEDEQTFFLAQFAQVIPVALWFAKVDSLEQYFEETPLTEPEYTAGVVSQFAHAFLVRPLDHCSWSGLPSVEVGNLEVLRGCTHVAEGLVVSNMQPLPLARVLETLPPLPAKQKHYKPAAGKQRETPASTETFMEKYPFLRDLLVSSDDEDEAMGDDNAASSTGKPGPKASATEDIPLDTLEALLEKLAACQRWCAESNSLHVEDFHVVVRGGKDLILRTGLAYDGIRGQCTKASEEWCVQSGFGKSRTFSTQAFGTSAARDMASTWCHKAQWYFDQFLAAGAKRPAVYEPYTHPECFEHLFLEVQGAEYARAEWLRALEPW